MSATTGDRMGLAQNLVNYGSRKGASEIEVSIAEGTESRLSVLDQNIDQLTESVFKNLNLRVFVDGKAASASSSDFTLETLERLVDNAVARARLAGQDPFGGLPEAEPIRAKAEDLKIFNPALTEVTVEQRIAALEDFRRGKSRVLVATDIAARGIDVEGISHVVNYDAPLHVEDYVHRIGRTGRMQAAGCAYTLVTPVDEIVVRRIEMVLQQKIERRRLDGIDYRAPALVQPTADAVRRYVETHRQTRQKMAATPA